MLENTIEPLPTWYTSTDGLFWADGTDEADSNHVCKVKLQLSRKNGTFLYNKNRKIILLPTEMKDVMSGSKEDAITSSWRYRHAPTPPSVSTAFEIILVGYFLCDGHNVQNERWNALTCAAWRKQPEENWDKGAMGVTMKGIEEFIECRNLWSHL